MKSCARILAALGVAISLHATVSAQDLPVASSRTTSSSSQPETPGDGRVQYPKGLANSFVTLNVGSINYAFSEEQLEAGHRAGSIDVPHTAARVMLFGHHFGKYVSLQGSYMRPIKYVRYRDVDGTGTTHTVWMHFGTVTAQARTPIGARVAIFGEGGVALTNRSGFELGDQPGVKDAHFWSPLVGGGIEYRLTPKLDVIVGTSFIPQHSDANNPATMFTSAGLRYTMRPLPPERVSESIAAGHFFPKNLIQIGYATDAFGFALNNFFNKDVPIFWGGDVKVKRSLVSLQWERNLFHTKKVFAIDLGASYGEWRSRDTDAAFRTLSLYPVLRFTFVRSSQADVYASFSQAGPTFISRVVIDDLPTGSHFTFQDFMAIGMFVGPHRRFNIELNLNHYSNGNLMSENAGVMVPLAVKLGYAF
jgi:Lipid A 3-O-deacylase (PagL)/OmpA-like transmembrane domain